MLAFSRALLAGAAGTFLMLASPAWADDACSDAWYARNLIAHRGGQCFSTNLGKAVFGNDGCKAAGPDLSGEDRDVMADIAAMEKRWGCSVDTGATTLSAPLKPFLDDLDRMPVRDDTESSCLDYRGDDIALHAAPVAGSRVVGVVRKGQSVADSFLAVGNWSIMEVFQNGETVAFGWSEVNIWNDECRQYAG